MLPRLRAKNCVIALVSGALLAFGLYHIHSRSGVTEGGILGLSLLLDHHFRLSPAISNFVLNGLCYLLGWRLLGREFIAYSAVGTVSFSAAYKLLERFPPLWPDLYAHPLLASILGAVFVGVSVGFCVRAGGALSGDDALAMSIAHVSGLKIQWIYLISDLVVLLLSLSYIPWRRLVYSLLTVILSGQLIGLVQKIALPGENAPPSGKEA